MILDCLNIKPEIAAYFNKYAQASPDNKILFKYSENVFESWSVEINRVPVTKGIWLAGADFPALTSDLYISYSAAELLCFASLNAFNLLRNTERQAFAALGLLPSRYQALQLKMLFPHARWHTLFGHDLLGKIADVSMAAWFKGHHIAFRVSDNKLRVKFRYRVFEFDDAVFSLNRFEKTTGLRPSVRTHKPPKGYPSFTSLNDDPGTV